MRAGLSTQYVVVEVAPLVKRRVDLPLPLEEPRLRRVAEVDSLHVAVGEHAQALTPRVGGAARDG